MYYISMLIASVFFTLVGLVITSERNFEKSLPSANYKAGVHKNITDSPIIIYFNGLEKGQAKNNGYSVEVYLDQPSTSNAIIGSVLGSNLYVFQKIRFYWASSAYGDAVKIKNQKCTPVQIAISYYNTKYKSFRNALNFHDGLIELLFPLKVIGFVANPLFTPFANVLKKIKKAGSQFKFPLSFSWRFYLYFPPVNNYLISPGAYLNESTGKTYPCSTSVVAPSNPIHFISIHQFQETFLSLLDYNDKPLVNSVTTPGGDKSSETQSIGFIRNSPPVKISSRIGNES